MVEDIMLKLRRYQASDNEVVKELHLAGIAQMAEMDIDVDPPGNPYFDSDLDDIEGVYINNRGDFIVGTENGEIVAIGAIRPASENCGEIKRIRVRRDCQRRGYGQTILLRLMERAVELGYREVCLDTLTSNLPAQQLFEKCGFKHRTREKRGPFELFIYRKKLDERGE
jgi:ribosomal protein S18 acetylase RimI-like enzyme